MICVIDLTIHPASLTIQKKFCLITRKLSFYLKEKLRMIPCGRLLTITIITSLSLHNAKKRCLDSLQ